MTLYIFRYLEIPENDLLKVTTELLGRTTYKRPALREEAPKVTDCLTSVHYIFKKAMKVNLSLTFIGDMPRKLIGCSEWRVMKVAVKDVKKGDIIFVKNKDHEKLLSHIALIIDTDKIFHCSLSFGTAVIQSNEDFFALYEQRLNFKEMVHYIDPRNKKLREEEKGIFIGETTK